MPFQEVAVTKDAEGHYYAPFLSDAGESRPPADDGSTVAYDVRD